MRKIHIETVESIHVACRALQDECHCLLQLTKYMYDDNLYQKILQFENYYTDIILNIIFLHSH